MCCFEGFQRGGGGGGLCVEDRRLGFRFLLLFFFFGGIGIEGQVVVFLVRGWGVGRDLEEIC